MKKTYLLKFLKTIAENLFIEIFLKIVNMLHFETNLV
jgi:hypothetical protein